MTSKPAQDLIDEHGAIMLMLRIMAKVAERIESTADVSKEHLEKIVDFIKTFADQCHHGKEEGILFPEMEKINHDNDRLINELLGEHKTGRDQVRGMAEDLPKYKAGNFAAFHIANNLKIYISLLESHIKKENEKLVTVFDALFSEEQLDEIKKKFDAIERDVIGQGEHEAYHQLLARYRNIYL